MKPIQRLPILSWASKYAYTVTIVIICSMLTLLMWFLYNHVYQTLIQAELVIELKGHTSSQVLETEQYQKAIETIKAKTKHIETTPITIITSTTTSSSTPPASNIEPRKNPFEAL